MKGKEQHPQNVFHTHLQVYSGKWLPEAKRFNTGVIRALNLDLIDIGLIAQF